MCVCVCVSTSVFAASAFSKQYRQLIEVKIYTSCKCTCKQSWFFNTCSCFRYEKISWRSSPISKEVTISMYVHKCSYMYMNMHFYRFVMDWYMYMYVSQLCGFFTQLLICFGTIHVSITHTCTCTCTTNSMCVLYLWSRVQVYIL